MTPGQPVTFAPIGRTRRKEGVITQVAPGYVRVVADGKHYTVPVEKVRTA